MNDISCEALFNLNQSQLINNIESPMSTSSIRMPRTHELHFYHSGTKTNQNHAEEVKELQCMYCKMKSIPDVSQMHKSHVNSATYLCYSCSVDLLADETVKTVLKKLCFRPQEKESPNINKSDPIEEEIEEEIRVNINNNPNNVEALDGQSYGVMICSQSDCINTKLQYSIQEEILQQKPKQSLSNNENSEPKNDDNNFTVNIIENVKLVELYCNEKRIGSGRFGKVSQMVHKETDEVVAVKTIIYRNLESRKNILNEIQILSSLRGNDYVLQLHEVIENNSTYPKCFHLITEYLDGGELYEEIAKDELLTEEQVIDIMCQLLNGVNFIHSNGIIHRDLKPENIVYTSKGSGHLKIIDFGFATKFDNENPPKTMVGTTVFVAPEVLRYESQSFLTDMWSVGVIAFNLLAGITPFEIPTTGDLRRQLSDMEIIENIERCQYDFNDDGFIGVSVEAKDFITRLLIRDPSKRLNALQCLQHVWLTSSYHNKFRRVARSISLQRVKNYVAIRKWQKISLAIQSINQFKNIILNSSKHNS